MAEKCKVIVFQSLNKKANPLVLTTSAYEKIKKLQGKIMWKLVVRECEIVLFMKNMNIFHITSNSIHRESNCITTNTDALLLNSVFFKKIHNVGRNDIFMTDVLKNTNSSNMNCQIALHNFLLLIPFALDTYLKSPEKVNLLYIKNQLYFLSTLC